MNSIEAKEKAKALFKEGYNCSQALLGCFCEEYGIRIEDALRLSAPFGGGMGRMREVCGAFSGMLMVLGLAQGGYSPSDRDAKKALYEEVQTLAARFREENGSILCRELLAGVSVTGGTAPEERTEQYYKKRPCAELVGNAAAMLCEYLQAKESSHD